MEQRINRDNYATQAELSRQLFLQQDQEAFIRRLNLSADKLYIYFDLMHLKARVERETGHIFLREPDGSFVQDASFNTVLTVYDFLCYPKSTPRAAGLWVSMQSMAPVAIGYQSSDNGFWRPVANRFSGRCAALEKACVAMGGEKMPVGDVAYAFPLFLDLRVCLQFWDGDDEFEPQIRFLWDSNWAQYLHFETAHYALGMLLARLENLM